MLKQFIEELYAARPSRPLYHYTSLQGLLAIMSARTLWATEVHYLNDAEELRHFGKRLDTEILRRLEQEHPRSDILRQFRRWLPDRLSAGPMIFVASFTENGNLLSQWRGYCPHGKGVSLGFEPKLLVAAAAGASFEVGKCVYDNASHNKAAALVVDAAIALAYEQGPTEAHPSQSYNKSFHEIEPDLLRIAALMKSGSFYEECEWRLISPVLSNYVQPPIRYREGVSTLVPYLEMPLPAKRLGDKEVLALHHIIVGPTPNPSLSMSAVSRYLSREGVRPTHVSNSDVPYRQT